MICLFQQLNQIALVLTSVRTFSVLTLLMGWNPSEVKRTKILSYRGKFVIKEKDIVPVNGELELSEFELTA